MNNFKDLKARISTKSFLIAVAGIELLIGTFRTISPEIFYQGITTEFYRNLLSIFYFAGAMFTILALETVNINKKIAFLLSLPTSFPFIYLAHNSLSQGDQTTTIVMTLIAISILLSSFFNPSSRKEYSISLLGLTTGFISIIIGVSLIFSYFNFLSVVFIISGLAILKYACQNNKLSALVMTLLSIPILYFGIQLSIKNELNASITYILFFVMLLIRALLMLFGFDDKNELKVEHQKLFKINRTLEFIAIGTLLLFIISTFSTASANGNKNAVIFLILIFSIATIFWFQILPKIHISKYLITSWLNLYSLFIVVICIFQSPTSTNPLILLYTIPIFACSVVIGKKETIYPTWIAIAGITLATLVNLSNANISYYKIIINSTPNFISVLSITYLARKIH